MRVSTTSIVDSAFGAQRSYDSGGEHRDQYRGEKGTTAAGAGTNAKTIGITRLSVIANIWERSASGGIQRVVLFPVSVTNSGNHEILLPANVIVWI